MKTFMGVMMSFVLMFGGFSGDKAPLGNNQMPVVGEIVAPMVPYVADYSGHFSAQVGESWQHRFQANKALKDNGAVFFIKLTEITAGGQYKVIVVGSKGYGFESNEYSGNASFTIKGINVDEDVIVYVINTSAKTVSGKVQISRCAI